MATIRAIQEEDAQQASRAQAGAALVQTFHNGPSRMDQVRSDRTTVSASPGGKIWQCMHGCGKVCEEKSMDPDRCSCRARLSGISGVIKKAAGMLQSKKRSCCLCKFCRVHAHTHARWSAHIIAHTLTQRCRRVCMHARVNMHTHVHTLSLSLAYIFFQAWRAQDGRALTNMHVPNARQYVKERWRMSKIERDGQKQTQMPLRLRHQCYEVIR